MVDKPTGNTEILVEKFFEQCRKIKKTLLKHTAFQRRGARKFKVRHPRASRTIAVTICSLMVGLVIVGFATPKTVTVNIDDSSKIISTNYETTNMRVDSFLENHEIDYVYGQDIIDVEFYDVISDNMEINIQKAVQVPVTADGKTQTVTILPTTVEELLKELEITVGEIDIVEPDMNHTLQKGDSVVVRRVTTGTVSEEVSVDYEKKDVASYDLSIGKVEKTQQGQAGMERRTYDVTYIDGVESTKTLISTETLQPKQDEIRSYGMRISSGIPAGLQYRKQISGVRAVAYNFPGNPKGAYGFPCKYGTCAVDPNVIPLGTKLYIEGYGYAIANDVGSAIKGNTVDLYMEDLRQCFKWGARTVNVYIVG